jgi:hypothetical protein
MSASYSPLVQSGVQSVGANAVSLAPRDVSAVRVFARVQCVPLFPLSALSASSLPRATIALRAKYASVICRPSQRVCKWAGTSGTGEDAPERENGAAAFEGGGAELGLREAARRQKQCGVGVGQKWEQWMCALVQVEESAGGLVALPAASSPAVAVTRG